MRYRRLNMLLSVFIVLTVIIGLGFQFGLFHGKPDFSSIGMYGTLSEINIGIYFLAERIWMKHHRRGVFAAFWKYGSFVIYLFGILIGWIFVYPFYSGLKQQVETAFVLLHVVLPVEVLLEWIIGEKGHFQKQFRIFGILPPCVYIVVVLILGAMKKGLFVNQADYPYSFLNVTQLGYQIVIPTCILYFLLLIIFSNVIVGIDTGMADRQRRKKRYDQTYRA